MRCNEVNFHKWAKSFWFHGLLFLSFMYPSDGWAVPKGLTDKELAEYWYNQGDTDKALRISKKTWRVFKTYGAGIDYATLLWNTGNKDLSEQTFDDVISKFPKKWDADIVLAEFYKKEEDYTSAEQVLKKLLTRMPNDIMAVKSYAGILLALQRADEAIEILDNYTPKSNEAFDYNGIYAAANYDGGYYKTAMEYNLLLIEMRPDLLDFQYNLGRCYRKLKMWGKARELYATLQVEHPNSGEAWKELGILEYELREFETAVEILETAKTKFEINGEAVKVLDTQNLIDEIEWIHAKTFMKRGDFATACVRLNQIRIRNDMLRYGFDTAICYREARQLDVATILFSELIHNHPTNSTLFVEYYETLKLQKDNLNAKKLLEDFVKVNGFIVPKIVARLASMYLGENDFQLALDTLQEAAPYLEGPPPLSFLFIAGNAHKGLKHNDLATELFRKATEQAPDLLDAHLELFNSINGSGNSGEAQLVLSELYEDFGLIPKVRLKRASMNLAAKFWDKVLEDCEVVLNDETLPDDAREIGTAKALIQEAKIGIARRHYAAGETYEAVNLFREVYFANPDSRNAINLGYFVSTISESNRTDTVMRNALSKDPTNKNINQVWGEVLLSEHRAPELIEMLEMSVGKDHIYQRGLSELMIKGLMEMGKWDDIGNTLEAIQEQPIQIEYDGPTTLGQLPDALIPIEAMYYQNKGEIQKAIQSWEKLKIKNPEVSAYPTEIALIYKSIKDYDTTRQHFQEMLVTFQDDANVWKQYSSFLMSQGDERGWKEAGQRAVDLLLSQEPTDFWPHLEWQMALGQAYFSLSEFDKAESVFRAITMNTPYYFPAFNVLGALYLEQKDYYNAEIAFKRARDLQPQNPYIQVALTQTFMRNMAPDLSRYWEEQSIPTIYQFDKMVQDLKASSLGVFGYRPLPWLGTIVDFTSLSVRPYAMMLVREAAFSDQPLQGFQIDQRVFKQQFGLFAPDLPALWINYTNVNSSGSLDVVANLMEFQIHHTERSDKGTLHIYPSFKYLLENEKFVQTTARAFPMGTLKAVFNPSKTPLMFAAEGSYGVQRLDKYGLPTEFYVGTISGARSVGMKSAFTSFAYRRDKLPSGEEFSSVITESALKTNLGKVIPSILVKTEYLIGLPKLGKAFGYQVMGGIEYRSFMEHYVPYSNFTVSRSEQYESDQTNTAEVGLIYQNGVMMKTREMNRWYEYKIPYQFKISFQQNSYPRSTIPTSNTLFFNFRII